MNKLISFFTISLIAIISINFIPNIYSESASQQKIYQNEKYGFSVVPPEGWEAINQNIIISEDPFVIFVTQFVSNEYNGDIRPNIGIQHSTFPQNIPSDFSDQEIFKKVIGAFEQSVNITSQNIERLEDHVQVTVEFNHEQELNNVKFLNQNKLFYWIFNSGDVYTYYLFTDSIDFHDNLEQFERSASTFTIGSPQLTKSSLDTVVPDWIKTNVGWWAEGKTSDSEFVSAMQFLINEKMIVIMPTTVQDIDTGYTKIPNWIKNNAKFWSDGRIHDSEFVSAMQFLIKENILVVSFNQDNNTNNPVIDFNKEDNKKIEEEISSLLELANTHYSSGKYLDAIKIYDKILDKNPNYFSALYNKGLTYNVLGINTEAMKWFDAALEVEPGNADALHAKGILFYNDGVSSYDQGQYHSAIGWFDAALEVEPGHNRASKDMQAALSRLYP